MPGATHGLLGLVEHALAHQEEAALTGPIAVHCRLVPCLLVLVPVVIVVIDITVVVVEEAAFTVSACNHNCNNNPKRLLTSRVVILPLRFREKSQDHDSDAFLSIKQGFRLAEISHLLR